MFSTAIHTLVPDWLQGILTHTYTWISSGSTDIVLSNPNYQEANTVNNTGIAIYCIHGTADRVAAFKKIANGIIDYMPDNISSIHLVAFDNRAKGRGIPYFAEQLRDKIKANHHDNVIVMGHSRGGLVAAYFESFFASDAGITVQAVMGICSPFLGSHLALPPLTLLSESVSQMQINSEFQEELTDKIQSSSAKYCYYTAERDAIVNPANSILTSQCFSRVQFSDHGHLSIMSSRRLMARITCDIEKICQLFKGEATDTVSFDQIESQFYVVSKDDLNSPQEAVCFAICGQIDDILSRFHLHTAAHKISVLSILYDLLETRDASIYPQASTIGGFIAAFLQDASQYHGRKPEDILAEPLNVRIPAALSFFKDTKSCSEIFVYDLIEKYKDIPFESLSPAEKTDKIPEANCGRRAG